MNCAEYRKAMLADPQHPSTEMRAHASDCEACGAYAVRLLGFERRLDQAMRVPLPQVSVLPQVPLQPVARARFGTGRPRVLPRVWAVAASVVLGFLVVTALWVAVPRASLAAAVVNHMADEPNAWVRTNVPVAEPKLDQVLRRAHMRLKPDAGLVSYANSCTFRGHVVPHLVVQTAAGPVTVMVLAQEPVKRPIRFDEQGYRGVIVPDPQHGSLAVLERDPNTDIRTVERVAGRVLNAIEWTG